MDNDFIFDIGGAEESGLDISIDGAEQLTTNIMEGLGVDFIDGLDEAGPELEIDLEDSTEVLEISDSVLIRASEDVSSVLVKYANCISPLIDVLSSRRKTVDKSKFLADRADFSYMSDAVFATFHNMLLDYSCEDRFQSYTPEQCASLVLDELYNASHWYPGLHRPEYMEKFQEYCNRFRKISRTVEEVDKSDISNLVSLKELKEAHRAFELNTSMFNDITNFFNDAASMASTTVLEIAEPGELVSSYITSNNLKVFTVKDAYTLISSHFGDPEVIKTLNITTDEALAYPIGELIRRLLVFEINSSFLFPSGVRSKDRDEIQSALLALLSAIKEGSVAAEILYLIGDMMLVTDKTDLRAKKLLRDIYHYFYAAIDRPSLINPVFYGHIKHTDSGYILSYAVGENTYEVTSKDILCDIIGDKVVTYCVPKIYEDSHGNIICPPESILQPMREMVSSTRTKISGGMCFKLSPTINWLIKNKVLAEEDVQEETASGNAMHDSVNSFLQVLVNYDNDFVDDGTKVNQIVVSYQNYKIYALKRRNSEEICDVYSVIEDDTCISSRGTLVYDKTTNGIIVSFFTLNGKQVDLIVNQGEYEEEYLESYADEEVKPIDIGNLVHDASFTHIVPYEKLRSSVKSLCDIASLDYDEELLAVQKIISRDLYYILGIPAIDTLVASRIAMVYYKLVESAKAAKQAGFKSECFSDSVDSYLQDIRDGIYLDNFNIASFNELVDIICGKPNGFTDLLSWDEKYAKVFEEYKEKLWYSVDDYCAKLDSLNFDILALQVTSRSELRSESHLAEYFALSYIPEIGQRLATLEDKMIILKAIDVLEDQMLVVLSRKSFVRGAYSQEFDKGNITFYEDEYKNKSKLGPDYRGLPLCKAILNSTPDADEVLMKYFILERNIYGLMSRMCEAPAKYGEKYKKFLGDLGLPEDFVVTNVTEKEFNSKIGLDNIPSFCEKNAEYLLKVVENGLLSEASSLGYFPLVKVYDLFCTFHEMLVGSKKTDASTDRARYQDAFLTYAGSMIISYCPVIDTSAGLIDGGTDRALAFAASSQDFVYDTPLDFLGTAQLSDMRVIIGEE